MKIAIGVLAFLLTVTVESVASDGCNNPKYEDRNQIDYGPLRLSRFAGVAIDITGAPLPQTCVYLFTEKTHHLIASAEADNEGKFVLQNIKAGSYRAVVVSDGFCSANIPVILKENATKKRLVVHMKTAAIDVCSYGDYK